MRFQGSIDAGAGVKVEEEFCFAEKVCVEYEVMRTRIIV